MKCRKQEEENVAGADCVLKMKEGVVRLKLQRRSQEVTGQARPQSVKHVFVVKGVKKSTECYE